jgi:hypothetical protein
LPMQSSPRSSPDAEAIVSSSTKCPLERSPFLRHQSRSGSTYRSTKANRHELSRGQRAGAAVSFVSEHRISNNEIPFKTCIDKFSAL